MVTIGINAAFHDSSAALVVDGKVVAAAEEERFSRIKHGKRPLPFTAWELPFNAIDFCLKQAGLTLREVDDVAYSYDPARFLRDRVPGGQLVLPMRHTASSATEVGADWENPWDPLFAAYILAAPDQLVDGAPHHLMSRFANARNPARAGGFEFDFHFVDHHLCHQASAFMAAPFDDCAVMTLDGRGEEATTTYGVYRGDRYRTLGDVHMPHSLGMLYEKVTTHLGFLHSSDEYKVMALAAMGKPRFAEALREQITLHDNGRYQIRDFALEDVFGPRRQRGAATEQVHFDIAASLQTVLEDSVLHISQWLREASGSRFLCMAGGVALNCVMNSRVRDAGIFDEVWVQPAAGDSGTALGAAMWIDSRQRLDEPSRADDDPWATKGAAIAPRQWQMEDAYLGPSFDDDEIEDFLRWAKLPYRRLTNLAADTAELLASGKVIGWFQGAMEYGPRALGARSILASPLDPAMQAYLNELKDREDFRPVAPAIPEEHLAAWFAPADANGGKAPFMLFIYDVLPEQARRIPAACHSDLTARVQTVTAATNPRFHALLSAFGNLTGVPILINTSFNVRGEPVVCTPKDAVHAYYTTPIDALVIGSFVLDKHP
ncbi:carbamoyltransferase C-terminal domain-containing protein [soil metagenome]